MREPEDMADTPASTQQGRLTYVWADKGSRPQAPRDQRYAWAYLFGAICPERGIGTGLVLPFVNTEAMNLQHQPVAAATLLTRAQPG